MSTNTKIILGVVIAGVLLLGAYLLFFNTNSDTSAITVDNAPASAAEVTFLNLATRTQPISFDTSIFNDSRFTTLIDTHTTVIPVPAGRSDPFAAIPGISAGN